MNTRHEPWKDVLHVEVHVPGFNLQKSIRKARLATQQRRSSAAVTAPRADQVQPDSDPELEPSPKTLGASSDEMVAQASDGDGVRFAL